MISLFMTFGVNHVSVPAKLSGFSALIKANRSGFLFKTLQVESSGFFLFRVTGSQFEDWSGIT